ncbi:hypothetical protein OV079_23150 [Nannocystis pusilla]|uniref:Uncharacterized protein n=1 Tax=Nannocystis pusilla TaxID=889268 RepID=A0A9X3ESG9_9BACT|nr:hypothetical protein [Nannocystis pusilla]MCY1008400.1 hypothetical protein [Nannocystis pusilla]
MALAPQARPQARGAAPKAPLHPFVRFLLIVLGVMVGSAVLATHAPVAAIVLGAGFTALAALYVAKADVRRHIDGVFGLQARRQTDKLLVAIVGGAWSFFALFMFGAWVASGGPEKAEAEKQARAAAERRASEAKAQQEAAARASQAEAKLNEAEALLGAGQLAQAQQATEQAKTLGASTDPRAAELQQRVDETVHRQAQATLPARHVAIADKAQSGAWSEARGLCEEARAIDPEHPQIKATCAEVDAELRKLDVGAWIAEANRAAAEQCDTPLAIGEAWKHLRQVGPADSGFKDAKKAAAKLEKCRKSAERTLGKALRDLMITQRTEWAQRYETQLLDSGLDVRVSLLGKYKDMVKIRWVLLGRATVHQLTKDGEMLQELQKIGFKRVTFSDGYFESWYFDLEPADEANGGAAALRGVGLERPIRL